jgi:hypothetical protein
MSRLILLIFLITIISQIVGWVKKSQQKERGKKPNTGIPKFPWDLMPVEEEKPSELAVAVEDIPKDSGETKPDNEFPNVDEESPLRNEEDFDEETRKKDKQTKLKPKKAPTQPKREPVHIAGFSINPKTIREGIIISEILKRPEF